MSRRRALLPALALLLAACAVGPPRPAAGTVEIGADLPLGGGQADAATAALAEVRQVVDVEYGGRVLGLPIRLHVYDETSNGRRDPTAAAQRLAEAAAATPLLGVVGPLDSDVALTEIPVAAATHLALVSPSAGSACLTRPLPECDGLARRLQPGAGPVSFFRVTSPDDGEAAALVRYAEAHLNTTQFAVGSDGQAYGQELRARFLAALARQHLKPALTADVDPTSAAAVDSFLTAARQAGAAVVLFGGRSGGGACRLAPRLAPDLGVGAALLGGSGMMDAGCASDAGAAAGSVYAAEAMTPDAAAVATRVLLAAIADAIRAQGGNLPTRDQVRAAVAAGSVVRFDRHGDPAVPVFTVYRAAPAAAGAAAPSWAPA